MKKERYKFVSYAITEDPGFMDEQNAMTPALRDKMEAIYFEVTEQKDGMKSVKKLLKLIEEFPQNPQLKNYLSVVYVKMGKATKAREANHWIQAEHPDYLFGKLNRAAEYFEKGEFEKMPEILGELMEIQSLYPERDTFHLAEVTGFFKIAILYFIATGNLEAARGRLKIMQEIAPDHPDTEFAALRMMSANMEKGIERWKEEEKTKIHTTALTDNLPEQITDPPVFTNEIIGQLYENDLRIEDELLAEIMNLPRESLITDLELILNDLLCRYEFFNLTVDENGWKGEKMSFPIHAIMLLGELRATESLPKILEVLGTDEDFLVFWFNDHLTETLWEPLYHLGNQQLELLINFVKKAGVYTYAKTAVSTAVSQISYQQPERKEEVIQWYAQLFEFFANSVSEDNVIDSDLTALLIWEVADLGYKELLPEIKKLYDKEYVSEGLSGEYADIEKDIAKPDLSLQKKAFLSLKQRYEKITTTWSGYTEEEGFVEDDDLFDDYEDLPVTDPVRTEPKIGRNEPCPCGSGKKYKKCCMNKTT